MPARVMLDTELYVTLLVSPEPAEGVAELFRAAVDGTFHLVIARSQLQELGNAIRNSSLLNDWISEDLLREP